MRLTNVLVFSIGLAAAGLPMAAPAWAQSGEAEAASEEPELTPLTEREDIVALIAAYDGNWVARGQSRTNFGDPLEAASCRMSSEFDAETDTLANDGRCANTQRAVELTGDLSVTEEGELAGGYFNRFDVAELLTSSGEPYEEGFKVYATYRAEIGSDPQEIDVEASVSRPELLENGDTAFSMVIEIRDPDTDEFVVFSQMVFTKRED